MAITYEKCSILDEKTRNAIVSSKDNWINFLKSASNTYKYNYDEQILIHAQFPNAKAVAPFDIWSKTFGRKINRNTKGIGLIDYSKDNPKIKYVFDISNTSVYDRNKKPPYIWSVNKEHEKDIIKQLSLTYNLDGDNLETIIQKSVDKQVNTDIQQYIDELRNANRLFTLADETAIRADFGKLLNESITFMVMQRCGIDTSSYFDNSNFETLFLFSETELSDILGKAVSNISETVLREIEQTVKNTDRRMSNERTNDKGKDNRRNSTSSLQGGYDILSDNQERRGDRSDLHTRPGNVHISSEHQRNGGYKGYRQMGSNEKEISVGRKERDVRSDVLQRNDNRPPDRNQRIGRENDGQPDRADGGTGTGERRAESQRPDGMGTLYELNTGESRRNSKKQSDIRINQQQNNETKAEEQSPAFSLSDDSKSEQIKFDSIYDVDEVIEKYITDDTKIPNDNFFPDDSADFIKEKNIEEVNKIQVGNQKEEENSPVSVIQTETLKESSQTSENFRIIDVELGKGSLSEKYNNNINAIKTLKTVENENRKATKDEQEILSKYVGWGGLSSVFQSNHKCYNELKNLLTDSEYEQARKSTVTAFYTSPVIIREMYNKLADMGVKDGKLLEPSCGVGNFIGMMPDNINTRVTGVELDSITGRIAAQLYPDADIQVCGFENSNLKENSFDVAVGNVPFGDIRVYDREYNKDNLLIHDYFFSKSLDMVKPGGIVAFITSKGTLDKQNDNARRIIAEKAEFLGAVRLPNNAFKVNAGTDISSDILTEAYKACKDKSRQ